MAIRLIWGKDNFPRTSAVVKLKQRSPLAPPSGIVKVLSGTPLQILAVPPRKSRNSELLYKKILTAAVKNACDTLVIPLPKDPALIAATKIFRELPEAQRMDISLDVSAAVPAGAWETLSALEAYLADVLRENDPEPIPKFPDFPDFEDTDDLPHAPEWEDTDKHPQSGTWDDELEPPEPPNLLDEDGNPLRTRPDLNAVLPGMAPPCRAPGSLEEWISHEDAGFSETLLNMIDAAEKKDSEVYNRANVSRQHFSKIRNNRDYKPTKQTAVAFAIALELDLEQTQQLIGSAGYVLNHSSKFDLIILYFLKRKIYDLAQINIALLAFDQKLLGM